jgi:DNA-binding transcriptional regulator YiaG
MWTRPASCAVSADEFRAAIAALGMSQRQAAAALEVDERTARRWALGERPIPGPARVALRCMTHLRGRGDAEQEVAEG